ncbi:MAG: ribonuclease M5 [Erysipelotrichales bacterium]|nr:ribonuclease M5 [Erysipelotrichales bacterium]
MYLQEVIIVEGKNDTRRLQMFFNVDTIETDGYRLRPETLDLIREANIRRGAIVFTDPDTPGENLRRRINDAVPGLKNAFLLKKDARTRRKVGVEHATDETILEALEHITPSKMKEDTLTYGEYLRLGLTGDRGSRERRLKLSKVLHIGYADAKVFFRYLNLIGVSGEDLERMLKDEE